MTHILQMYSAVLKLWSICLKLNTYLIYSGSTKVSETDRSHESQKYNKLKCVMSAIKLCESSFEKAVGLARRSLSTLSRSDVFPP